MRYATRIVAIATLASIPITLDANEKLHGFSRENKVLIENAPSPHSVDETINQDLTFRDIDGTPFRLVDLQNEGPVVFVFTSSECPMAKRYSLRLGRLAESFASEGVSFFAVHSNADDSLESIRNHRRDFSLPFPVVKDHHAYLANRLGATTTPQAVIVDQTGDIAYRGAIDDNRYENKVTETYLSDALTQIVANQQPSKSRTAAFGCAIHQATSDEIGSVTYSEHIARIVQDKCQSCHRPDQVAPFSLTNYRKTKAYATEIREQVLARAMPPWQPTAHPIGYQGDISLSQEEIALVTKWVDQGCPQGDPALTPPNPEYSDSWTLGEPDMIVSMEKEYIVGPEGEDDYRHFIIKKEDLGLTEDHYVAAIDVQPGNRDTVHHVIVYVDKTGVARELDAAAPGYGYTRVGGVGFQADNSLGGWAPGNRVSVAPDGFGKRFSAEGDIVLQVHYYRTGRPEHDLTRVGLYFSKAPDPKPIEQRVVINTKFSIAPGERNYPVTASHVLEDDYYATSVYPHMHQFGQRIKIDAEIPGTRNEGGKEIPLVYIKEWDFNWQGDYMFQEPIFLPQGTKIKVACLFDNPTDQTITWGEATSDEMAIGFLSVIKATDWRDPLLTSR